MGKYINEYKIFFLVDQCRLKTGDGIAQVFIDSRYMACIPL